MKWLISLMLLAVSANTFAQENMKPVSSTGKSYTVLINDAQLNESSLSYGDTVAVFDGELSVGAAKYEGEFPLVISAWEGSTSQNLEGFTSGNSIKFKVKSTIYDSVIVYEPSITFEEGDGTFGYGAFTSATLNHQTSFSPGISVNKTSLNFGSVRRGEQANAEFVIANSGDAKLQIYSIDSNDSQIQVNYTANNIAEGGSQTITVSYTPTKENPLDATLTINTSDPSNGATTVSLSGQGLPALAPVLSMEPNTHQLGNLKLQDTKTVKSRIYNRGNDTLRISSVTSSNSDVLTVDLNDFEIPSGEYSEISFTVQAKTVGQNSANIQFQSNGANGTLISVPVSWIGYEGHFAAPEETGLPYSVIVNRILVDNRLPKIGSEIALMQGETVVGLGVYSGSFPLSITAWEEDSQQGLNGFTPGDSISAKINTLKYNQQLEIGADIEFERGDRTYGDDAFSVIDIKGITGLAPILEIDESPLIYNELPQNYTEVLRKWILNKGEQDLNIISTNATGNYHVVEVGSYTIPGGDSTYVDIEFSANSVGINKGVFTLETNDPFNSNADISLRGRGLIEVSEERVSLSGSESPWLHSPLNSDTELSLMLENNFARTEVIDLSIENSTDVSLKQSSITIAGNESKRLGLNVRGNKVSADTLQLVLTYQDGSRQEIELYQLSYENHFDDVVETGMPYSLILNIDEPGKPYSYGDQIAVFDGDQIVGLHVWKGSNSNIPITAWKANSSNGLPGYTDGNDISFKVYKTVYGREERTELEAFSSTFNKDGAFGSGAFQVATVQGDEPIYFKDPFRTVYFRENEFSHTTFASLDTLVRDPNRQSITHTFSSDTSALAASKFANFYRLQLQQGFFGKVKIAHLAETETSLAKDTTTFIVMDKPEFRSPESHDVYVGEANTMALFDVQMERELTQTVNILNEGYANLNVIGDSLYMEVLKEGVFYVDVNVTDNYGYDITKRLSFTARYKKPWISAQTDTLRFDTTYTTKYRTSTIQLKHLLPLNRKYSIEFENGSVFSSNMSEVSLSENGTSEIEVTFSPNSENVFSDALNFIYKGFETDTNFTLPIHAVSQTLPDPEASLSENSLSFGDVEPGETKEETLTLTNTGLIDIQLDSVAAPNTAFAVDISTNALEPDSSMDLSVSFSPEQIGEYTGSLHVYVKDVEPMKVSLDGRGAAAIAELSTHTYDFGRVNLSESSQGEVWLYNKGNIALPIDEILMESEVFAAQIAEEEVPAFDSVAVNFSFTPNAVFEYNKTARLVVDGGSDTLELALHGTGFTEPKISLSENSLSFGDVKPGEIEEKTLTLTNTGLIDIQLDSVAAPNTAFAVHIPTNALEPDSSLNIGVTFSPEELKKYTDSLHVYVKDVEPMKVSLNGRGAAAIAELSTDTYDFGRVNLGKTEEAKFWLYNKGNIGLTIDTLLLESEVFAAQIAEEEVPAFDSVAVNFSFTPNAVLEYNQTVQLVVDGGFDTLELALHGTGFTEPKISLSENSISFGDVKPGETKERTLTLTNTGLIDIQLDSVVAPNTAFAVDISTNALEPDSSIDLSVSFSPDQIGEYTGSLHVYVKDVEPMEVSLDGRGAAAIAELSTHTYDFGRVNLGKTEEAKFWLYNKGNIGLTIDTLLLESEMFSAQLSTKEISAFDSIAVNMTFEPEAMLDYSKTAQLVVDSGADTLLITLSGEGYTGPNASVSANILSFGDVEPGETKEETLTLTNTGLIDIQLDSVVSPNTAFAVHIPSNSLEPDSSLNIGVTFSPEELKEYTDSLHVYVKDVEPMKVSLNGRGAAAIAELSAHTYDYEKVKIGDSSKVAIWLYNKGNIALPIDEILMESEVFAVQIVEEEVPAFDSIAVSMTFKPQEVMDYSQVVRLVVDGTSDTLEVNLNGSGVEDLQPEPSISFSVDSLSFNDTFIGQPKTDTLVIHNNGDVALNIDSIVVSNQTFTLDFQPLKLKPNVRKDIPISFQPSQMGLYLDTLQVFIEELGVKTILMSGLGIIAVPELSESSYDFGEVKIGESSEVDLWLYNRGNTSLVIDTLILKSEVFSVEISEPEVGAKDSVNITARFTPDNAESYESELLLKANAVADTIRLFIKGLGVSSVSVEESNLIPAEYALEQNYPNPFNPSTTIKYGLPEAADVQLVVYDLLGRQVAELVSKQQNAGFHILKFDAAQLATGIYIYRIKAGNFVQTKKLMLIK